MARMLYSLLLLTILTTLVGCQSVGVAFKITPSKLDPSRFEYSLEFTDRDSRRR